MSTKYYWRIMLLNVYDTVIACAILIDSDIKQFVQVGYLISYHNWNGSSEFHLLHLRNCYLWPKRKCKALTLNTDTYCNCHLYSVVLYDYCTVVWFRGADLDPNYYPHLSENLRALEVQNKAVDANNGGVEAQCGALEDCRPVVADSHHCEVWIGTGSGSELTRKTLSGSVFKWIAGSGFYIRRDADPQPWLDLINWF